MRSSHFIRAAAVWALGASIGAQAQPIAPIESPVANLTTFVRGTPIGTEQVTLTRTADGWTISSTGRLAAPIDAVARRIEARYTADWRPREFTADVTLRGTAQSIHTVIDGTQARSAVDIGGQRSEKTDTIDPGTAIVMPNTFFGPFEAVAARLKFAAAGTEIPLYAPPVFAFTLRVGESSPQQIQTTARMIAARRTRVTLVLPSSSFDGDIWTDEASRLIRFSLPAQSLEIVRDDVASVAARSVTISRPNDESVRMPGNGFVLAGTLSRPSQPAAAGARLPAVVLVGGSGPTDRDGIAFGIPVLGQLADAIADAGFIAVRYDKRGIGQSGGRAESAGLADYAEDVRAVVKFLADRKDVDPKRIAVVGHSEGGIVALISASKEKRIGAVALLSSYGTSGADAILAQQQRALDRATLSPQEREAKVDLQKRIHQAVLTGKGWDQISPDIRKAVDNPEFQSILSSNPAKIMADVKQPVLIVQGELDTHIDPANADRLASLARERKKQPPTEVVKVPGVNHLLVPATTGEAEEYPSLADKHVSRAVTDAIVTWLKKTL